MRKMLRSKEENKRPWHRQGMTMEIRDIGRVFRFWQCISVSGVCICVCVCVCVCVIHSTESDSLQPHGL